MKAYYSLDAETPLIPEMVAETITQDAEEIEYVCHRARIHYVKDLRFRRKMRCKSCREWLIAFMDHWIGAMRKSGIPPQIAAELAKLRQSAALEV